MPVASRWDSDGRGDVLGVDNAPSRTICSMGPRPGCAFLQGESATSSTVTRCVIGRVSLGLAIPINGSLAVCHQVNNGRCVPAAGARNPSTEEATVEERRSEQVANWKEAGTTAQQEAH